jgi:hypothetical protein
MDFKQQMPIKVWALVVYDKPKACLGKASFIFFKIDVYWSGLMIPISMPELTTLNNLHTHPTLVSTHGKTFGHGALP